MPREKTKDEQEREEEEYREFLRQEVGEDLRQLIQVDRDVIGIHENVLSVRGGDEEKRKKKKKDKVKEQEKGWYKPKEKEEEDREFLMKFVLLAPIILRSEVTRFLYSYILNRGWIDRSAKRLPTYTEVTGTRNRKKKPKVKGPGDEGGAAAGSSGSSSRSESDSDSGSNGMIEDEDEFEDVADVFESSYNFRFEEPYVVPEAAEISTFTLPTEMQLKFLVTRVTSLPPSVAKILHGRKLEHAERLVKKKRFFKNAKKSSD